MFKSSWSKVAVLLVVLCVGAVAEATPWTALGPKRKIDTVILTGNFKSPRLMAELIMLESRQPHILLPNRPDDDLVIVRLAKNNSFQIREEHLGDFVANVQPRRVVILGDERYVPSRYEEMLYDKETPVVRIYGKDWNRVAEELSFMLNLSNLADNFKKLYQEDVNAYRLISAPAESKPAETAPSGDASSDESTETQPVEPAEAE